MKTRKILCVVGYDISGDKLRKKVDKLLSRYGSRINRSLFECMVTTTQYQSVLEQLKLFITSSNDSVVVYRICADCYTSREVMPYKQAKYSNVKIA